MATVNTQPRADQPRVTTGSLKSGERQPNLEYRVQGVQTYSRSPKTRNLARSTRG